MSNLIRTSSQGGVPAARHDLGVPGPEIEGQRFDLRHLWLVMFKRRWLIILAVLCTTIPTVIYVQFTKPLFRSTATIQVDPESAKVLPYKDVSDSLSNPTSYYELYMKTQGGLLKSGRLLARVSRRIQDDLGPSSLAELSHPLSDGLQVKRVEGSQMLSISYTAYDPKLAASVANAWAEEFLKLNAEARAETGEKATEFLQGQLKALKLKVEKAEADLVEYARRNEILNIDSKQGNVIRQRFSYLDGEVSRAEKDFIAKKAEYEGLKAVSAEDIPESLKSPAIAALETRLFQTEQELSKLLAQFDERWPAVVQKKEELALVKAQLLEATKAILGRATKEAEMKYNATRSEYDMLRRALNVQASLVGRLNEASVEYNALRRELEAGEQLYQGLLQRLKETGVSAGLEFGNIHIADRATPVYAPYLPRKALSLSLAVLLGLTVGVGISFVLESVNRTLGDPWEVEKLGLPLLSWIPKGAHTVGLHRLADSDSASAQTNTSLLPLTNARAVESLTKAQHQARESFRTLCASLLLSRPESPPRTVLITSSAPGEGKSTTTASLGITLSEMGSPTLLVDADFRNPGLGRMFGANGPEGLSTYLAGGKLVVRPTDKPNLFLLTAGLTPPNPVALLGTARIREALDQLTSRFKFILIDSPPLLSVADASILAAKVDGVIFVIHSGITPKEVVSKTLVQLQRTTCCILGAVVNHVDLKNPEYSYYQKYYYQDNVTDLSNS